MLETVNPISIVCYLPNRRSYIPHGTASDGTVATSDDDAIKQIKFDIK